MNVKLGILVNIARDLIGDSTADNPEYTRAMVELIANTLPGDSEAAREYVETLLAP